MKKDISDRIEAARNGNGKRVIKTRLRPKATPESPVVEAAADPPLPDPPPPPAPEPEPEPVKAKSPKAKKKRRNFTPTKANIENLQQQWYLDNIAELVGASYPMLIEKIKGGNVKALEMGLKVANILKPDNGISVVTNLYNKTTTQVANVSSDRPGGIQSFESILRQLEASDASQKNVIEGTVVG